MIPEIIRDTLRAVPSGLGVTELEVNVKYTQIIAENILTACYLISSRPYGSDDTDFII